MEQKGEIMIAKIHIENCEEDFDVILNIEMGIATDESMQKVKQVLQNFINAHEFTFAGEIIDELRKHGFNAKELEYGMEIRRQYVRAHELKVKR